MVILGLDVCRMLRISIFEPSANSTLERVIQAAATARLLPLS